MKKCLLTLLLINIVNVTQAAQFPTPSCVNGKWQTSDSRWSVTESSPCTNDQDILPVVIQATFVNPHGGAKYTNTVHYFNATNQSVVTMVSQYYAPWGGSWTGNKRSSKAFCPSETGRATLQQCPIVIPG